MDRLIYLLMTLSLLILISGGAFGKQAALTKFAADEKLNFKNESERVAYYSCLFQCQAKESCLKAKVKAGNDCEFNPGDLTVDKGEHIISKAVKDCSMAYTSGIYQLDDAERNLPKVYCQRDDTGSWTVIQRRQDGSVDFFRKWADYKSGFGDLNGEFWLGNDAIHELTKAGDQKLRVDMEDWDGVRYTVEYNTFTVAGESDNYRLAIGGFTGTDPPGNNIEPLNGRRFSTTDRDFTTKGCPASYKGAFWYEECHSANPNGQYNNTNYGQGINWRSFRGYSYSLKFFSILLGDK